jgi:hypothetical protein
MVTVMKYFTPEWWASAGEDSGDALERYRVYLSSIESFLPKSLVELEAEYTLHDSIVDCVVSNFNEQVVDIKLNGWDREFKSKVKYILRFKGVFYFEQNIPDTKSFKTGFGDLGYWEYEKLSEQIEMRMLFASNTEFCIRFSDFEFSHEPIPNLAFKRDALKRAP